MMKNFAISINICGDLSISRQRHHTPTWPRPSALDMPLLLASTGHRPMPASAIAFAVATAAVPGTVSLTSLSAAAAWRAAAEPASATVGGAFGLPGPPVASGRFAPQCIRLGYADSTADHCTIASIKEHSPYTSLGSCDQAIGSSAETHLWHYCYRGRHRGILALDSQPTLAEPNSTATTAKFDCAPVVIVGTSQDIVTPYW